MANLLINTVFNDIKKEVKKTNEKEMINPVLKKSNTNFNNISIKTNTIPPKKNSINPKFSINPNLFTNQNTRPSTERTHPNNVKIIQTNKKIIKKEIISPKQKQIRKTNPYAKVDPIVEELRTLNFEQLLEKISKDPEIKKKYEATLNSESTLIKKKENKYKPEVYRPSDSEEVKQFERINEANKELEVLNRLSKKRNREKDELHGNQIGNKLCYQKSKVMYEEEYCQECCIYHKIGKHVDTKKRIEIEIEKMNPDKKPTTQRTTQIFRKTKNDLRNSSVQISRIQEQIIKQRNEKIYGTKKLSESETKVNSLKILQKTDNHTNSKNHSSTKHLDRPSVSFSEKKKTYKKPGSNKKENELYSGKNRKLYNEEENHEEDLNDFIDDDIESNEYLDDKMRKNKKSVYRIDYSPTYYKDDSESENMEAGFDEIEKEEMHTQRIADKEDEMEKLREKMILNKKKQKVKLKIKDYE